MVLQKDSTVIITSSPLRVINVGGAIPGRNPVKGQQ